MFFTSRFYNIYRPNEPSHYDTESLIHIFNTRQIPSGFELHPELTKAYSYRNKVVTFYTTSNYFIHIYEPRHKHIDRHWQLLDLFLKNTFSNGFMIHYRSGIFLSTNAFKEDFEPVRRNLIDFIWSFKLACYIYENLNFIPFSFYRLPPSSYFSSPSNSWNFPLFEDKPVDYYFDYLALNFILESSRSQDVNFKSQITSTIDLLTQEILTIKQAQQQNA